MENKEDGRAILTLCTLEYTPRAGDREIRMKPIPVLNQSRPRQKEDDHV